MDKKLINTFKQKLKKEKAILEKELKTFAKQDKNLKDNWNTLFPNFGKETGSADLEKSADEVEEYATLLPIEHTLEIKLKNINLALEKIKKGNYPTCEKCGEEINEKRLRVYPEARFCLECKNLYAI